MHGHWFEPSSGSQAPQKRCFFVLHSECGVINTGDILLSSNHLLRGGVFATRRRESCNLIWSDFICTSRVVEIFEKRGDFAHFESMDFIYRVALVSSPVTLAIPKIYS